MQLSPCIKIDFTLFIALSRRHVLVIAWIYVITVLVVFSFAIEIGQGFTGTGNMDLEDVISGLAGFMLLFLLFAAVRGLILFLWRLVFPQNIDDTSMIR